jgi:hypothetical protein
MDVVMNGNGLVLGPGTYWLDFNLGGSLLSGPFVPPVTIPSVPQTGNGRQDPGTGWVPTESGNVQGNITHQGLPFQVAYTCQPLNPPQPVFLPMMYFPGSSYGPIGAAPNPVLELDQFAYATAYWEMVDSCGGNSALAQAFSPLSPAWSTFNSLTSLPTDPDPFGEGRVLFRHVFHHRLQLDPLVGPIFDLDHLIASDPWVALQWRFWTQTHQLITADFLDPVAHTNHILAVVEALTVGFEWQSRGAPYFDQLFTIAVSENTKKKVGAPAPPPAPLNVATLPANVQTCDAAIRAKAGALSGFPALYDPDGSWFLGHVGFDCDDFADAIGSYIKKGVAGMSATTVRVTWTTPGGQSAAHRVTKICYLGYYWLVDAQTGAVNGPHLKATAVDARPVVGGYAIDGTKPITTTDDGRALGSRPGFGEPPPWYEDAAQRARFQMITGLDPNCFRG